jgi:hypothetical protein
MSYVGVNKAVAGVVMEAKMSVVDDLVQYLESKIEVDDDLRAMFDEFKSNLKESEEKVVKDAGKKTKAGKKVVDGEKKKRAPSVFNLYVKDVMPLMKATHPDVKDGKLMIGYASESWKSSPKAAYIKDLIMDWKKEDKTLDVVEMYAKAKGMWDENGNDDIEAKEVEEKVEEKVKSVKGKAAEKAAKGKAVPKGKAVKKPEPEEDADAEEEVEEVDEEEKPKEKTVKGKKAKKESDEDEE